MKIFKSLLEDNPKLAEEIHPTKNLIEMKFLSRRTKKKIWWLCSKCGFEWETSPNHRNKINGTGCPNCKKGQNTSFPEQVIFYYLSKLFICENRKQIFGVEVDIYIDELKLAIEYDGFLWHKETLEKDLLKYHILKENNISLIRIRENRLKNIECNFCFMRENTYSSSMNLVIEAILNFINKLNSINYNIDFNLKRDNNDIIQNMKNRILNNSFILTHPQLLNQWDYDKNKGLNPLMYSTYSSDLIWWKCDVCSESWQAVLSNRTRFNHKCSYCTGKSVGLSNCLATLNPCLSKQWHPTLNELTPFDVTCGSKKKIWWICELGHIWQSTIQKRHSRGDGCKECRKHKK